MDLLSRDVASGPEGEASSPGDRLEKLVARHRGFIREIVSRLAPEHLGVAASEIEQEAMIRLWRSLRNEREIRDFRSYVYRVVATCALDAIREVKTRREEQLVPERAADLSESPGMPGSRASSPEETLHRRTLLARIREVMARLSANRGRAVKLHLQGFTSDEIGELYGWSEAKARNLVSRGLGDLRALLRREGIEYD